MIELPPLPAPNDATPSLVDYGGTQRGPNGTALRVDRLGSHYRLAVSFPPFDSKREGRIFVSRLIRAKRQGLRLEYPLLSADQPVSGTPVVDGAGQAGVVLMLRGLFRQTSVLEGWWLSIEDASGQHYLHNVAAGGMADADGRLTIEVEPMLRRPFADGARVHLARPMIEGIVEGDEFAWHLALNHNIDLSVTIEEAA